CECNDCDPRAGASIALPRHPDPSAYARTVRASNCHRCRARDVGAIPECGAGFAYRVPDAGQNRLIADSVQPRTLRVTFNSVDHRHGHDSCFSAEHSPGSRRGTSPLEDAMLWTLIVILFILWILGFGVFHVAGGLIHLLLVIAVILLIVRLATGRRPVV